MLRQRLAKGFVALSLVFAALVAMPGVASAASGSVGPGNPPGGYVEGGHWKGGYWITSITGAPISPVLGFCISPTQASPNMFSGNYTAGLGSSPGLGNGYAATLGWIAEIAALFGHWTDPSNGADYSANDVADAITYITYGGAGGNPGQFGNETAGPGSAVYNDINSFANAFPGPWNLTMSIPTGTLMFGQTYTGTLTLTGGTTGFGNIPVPGIGAPTLSMSGGTIVSQPSGNSDSSGQWTFTFTPSGGPFSFGGSMSNTPNAQPWIGTAPSGSGGQNMFLAIANNTLFLGGTTTGTAITAVVGMNTPSNTTPLVGQTVTVSASITSGSLPSGYTMYIYQDGNQVQACSAGGAGAGFTCTASVSRSSAGTSTFTAAAVGGSTINSTAPASTSATWGTGNLAVVGSNACVTTGGANLQLTVPNAADVGSDGSVTVTSTSGERATFAGHYSGVVTVTGGSLPSPQTAYVTYNSATGGYLIAGWPEATFPAGSTPANPLSYSYSATITFGSSVSPGSTPAGLISGASAPWFACTGNAQNAYPA